MIEKIGNVWGEFGKGYICITTNSTLNRKGDLVMGAGIAKEASELMPWLPSSAGYMLEKENCRDYGLMHMGLVGLFQVKRDWRDSADLNLIEYSTSLLKEWAMNRPTMPIHLNFPGIGFGKLTRDEVLPIVKKLPNNVCIWSIR